MIAKEQFSAQLERAGATVGELPVTAALLGHLSGALKSGEPDWWARTQKAWQSREFVAWTEPWSLFLTAVHEDVLGDPGSPLRRYFPSCGGTAEADPSTVFARYLDGLPRQFYSRLRGAHRRPFVAARAPLWIAPAASFFQRRGLPFYLVEINCGAGLNLAADLHLGPRGFDSSLIAARIGLDSAPLRLEEPDDQRWLRASHPPEAVTEIAKTAEIASAVGQRMQREAAFIQLATCEAPKAPAFLARNIPADDPNVGLLVFNMGATVRLNDADYAKFRAALAETLAPWGERGLWLEVETVRGEVYSTTLEGLLHRPDAGGLRDHVMARFDMGSRQIAFDARAADAFLAGY